MNNLEKFCSIVKKRSEENAQSIKLLCENKLYGNCIAILRNEIAKIDMEMQQQTRDLTLKWHATLKHK